jgi:hypothetical protein
MLALTMAESRSLLYLVLKFEYVNLVSIMKIMTMLVSFSLLWQTPEKNGLKRERFGGGCGSWFQRFQSWSLWFQSFWAYDETVHHGGRPQRNRDAQLIAARKHK